jgi:rhodanese-related sulfurtransferase
MSDTPVKSTVLALLRRARTEELDLIAALSESALAATGTPDMWSAKDTIAHIAAWRQRHADKLAATLCGDTPPRWTDMQVVDALNAEQYPRHAAEPWPAIATCSERAYNMLLAQVEGLSEQDLADSQRFPALHGESLWGETLGNGVWHPFTHMVALARARGDDARVAHLQAAELSAQEEVARLETARGASAGERAASEYNLACRYALAGRADSAITALRQALLLRPELALHARHDDDLTTLREHPAYLALTSGAGDAELITAEEARARANAGAAVVIDVREPSEYAEGHVAGAINIPLAGLHQRLAELPAGQTLVTYCNMRHRGASRCEMAASLLASRGYDARALDGGYPGWTQSGYPVEEPES